MVQLFDEYHINQQMDMNRLQGLVPAVRELHGHAYGHAERQACSVQRETLLSASI